ncbi:MAG: hypothetical protein RL839_04865 [Gammaproteobacteria bacterium]
MKSLLLLTVLGTLVACVTPEPRFHQMSDAELMAYNESRPIRQQVYCRDEVQVGSHIRQRVCSKVQDVIDGKITTLNTASSSTSVPYRRQ